jgi:hypothetical protein
MADAEFTVKTLTFLIKKLLFKMLSSRGTWLTIWSIIFQSGATSLKKYS